MNAVIYLLCVSVIWTNVKHTQIDCIYEANASAGAGARSHDHRIRARTFSVMLRSLANDSFRRKKVKVKTVLREVHSRKRFCLCFATFCEWACKSLFDVKTKRSPLNLKYAFECTHVINPLNAYMLTWSY